MYGCSNPNPNTCMDVYMQVLVRRFLAWILSPVIGPMWSYIGRCFMRTAETGGKG